MAIDYSKLREEDKEPVKGIVEYLESKGFDVELRGGATRGYKSYRDIDLLAQGSSTDVIRAQFDLEFGRLLSDIKVKTGLEYHLISTRGVPNYVGTKVDVRNIILSGGTNIDLNFKSVME